MSDKTWGKTVLGWFVVQEGKPQEANYDQSGGNPDDYVPFSDASSSGGDESAAAPAAPPPPATAKFQGELPQVKEGKVDFEKVFETAGVDAEERSRVDRARELLNSLPAGTDDAVKKQIVHASLKAFGVPIEKIIETGVEEIQALESYIRAGSTDTEKVIEESEKRIKMYEDEIKQLKTVMQDRVAEQQIVIKSCNEKKLEIQHVLEFLGREAVEKVVKASPKLVDPSAPTNA
jgi:hypothetical protein